MSPSLSDYTAVEFYGASDDLIEVHGAIPGCDEYSDESALFEVCGLRVAVDYMANGCWGIRCSQIDEGVPVTARDITLRPGAGHSYSDPEVLAGRARPESGYSMYLRMLVPPGSHVTRVGAP